MGQRFHDRKTTDLGLWQEHAVAEDAALVAEAAHVRGTAKHQLLSMFHETAWGGQA